MPLDDAFDPHKIYPFDVVVPAAEVDALRDHVAQVHLLQWVFHARLGAHRGAAGAVTMQHIAAAIRLVLPTV